MTDLIRYAAFNLLLAAGLVVLAVPFAARRRAAPCLAFVAVSTVQTVALAGPLVLGWRLGHWNWIGKLASIATSLVAIRILHLTRTEIGLVLPRGRTGWLASITGLAGGLILVISFVLVFGPNPIPDAETLAFQASMPGLDEELAFRGVGMALLARGYPTTRFALPVWALPVVMTSIPFTMVHVVNIEHGHMGLQIGAALYVLPMGLLLALIRVGSSSLVGCVLAHNATNVMGFLAAFALPATAP